MAAIRGLVEVVLVVEDIERAWHFYRDVLGLETISPGRDAGQIPPHWRGARRRAAADRVGPAGDGCRTPLRPTRALHHIGLEVASADFEAERARLVGLGFELRGGTHPFMPVEAFYLDDPDGNEIEIATWRGTS